MKSPAERIQEVIKSQLSKPGWRGRINAKCVDCSYDPIDRGNWRQQVEGCTVTTCPLWDIRPKSRPHVKKEQVTGAPNDG